MDDVVMEDVDAASAPGGGGMDHEKENGGIVTSSLDAERHKETARAKEMTLLERFEHKNWKVRAEAYEEAAARAAAGGWDAQELGGGVLAKALADSNAPAQEKALDLMSAHLRRTDEAFAGRFSGAIMKSVVQKCLNGRAGTVGKATEVSMLLVELGEAEEVVAAFMAGTGSKQAKVALASLNAASEAVNSFGAAAIGCKPVIRELPRLFDSRDSKVREKAKEFAVDLCTWLGLDTMRALLLDKMRDAMRKDVEALVSARDGQRMRPTRRLRRDSGDAGGDAGAPGGRRRPMMTGSAARRTRPSRTRTTSRTASTCSGRSATGGTRGWRRPSGASAGRRSPSSPRWPAPCRGSSRATSTAS